jgi:hypothetical protein
MKYEWGFFPESGQVEPTLEKAHKHTVVKLTSIRLLV